MKKPKRKRTPAHRVNRRQKALAIKALTSIVESPDAAEYVKARAAAALLNDGRETPDGPIERDPDAPRKYVVLPENGRDPDQRFGLWYEDQRVVIVPDGFPFEVMPEAHYAGVTKRLADPRIAHRNRAERLALPGPIEDEAA